MLDEANPIENIVGVNCNFTYCSTSYCDVGNDQESCDCYKNHTFSECDQSVFTQIDFTLIISQAKYFGRWICWAGTTDEALLSQLGKCWNYGMFVLYELAFLFCTFYVKKVLLNVIKDQIKYRNIKFTYVCFKSFFFFFFLCCRACRRTTTNKIIARYNNYGTYNFHLCRLCWNTGSNTGMVYY